MDLDVFEMAIDMEDEKAVSEQRPVLKKEIVGKVNVDEHVDEKKRPDGNDENDGKKEKTDEREGKEEKEEQIIEKQGFVKIINKRINHIIQPSSKHLADANIKNKWPLKDCLFLIGGYKLVGTVRALDMELFTYTITAKESVVDSHNSMLWKVIELQHYPIQVTFTNWRHIFHVLIGRHQWGDVGKKNKDAAILALSNKPLSIPPLEWLKQLATGNVDKGEAPIQWAYELYNGAGNTDFLTEHFYPGLSDFFPLHTLRTMTMIERNILFEKLTTTGPYPLFFYENHFRETQIMADSTTTSSSSSSTITNGSANGLIDGSVNSFTIPFILPAVSMIDLAGMYNSDKELKSVLGSLTLQEFLSIWFYAYINMDQALSNDTASLFYDEESRIITRDAYKSRRYNFNDTSDKLYRLLFASTFPNGQIPYSYSFGNFLNGKGAQSAIVKYLLEKGYFVKERRRQPTTRELREDSDSILCPSCRHIIVLKHWHELSTSTLRELHDFNNRMLSDTKSNTMDEAKKLFVNVFASMEELKSAADAHGVSALEKSQFETAMKLDKDQKQIFNNLLNSPISLICGPGGSGKSMCNQLLCLVQEEKHPPSTMHAVRALTGSGSGSGSGRGQPRNESGRNGSGSGRLVESYMTRAQTRPQDVETKEKPPMSVYKKKSTGIIFTPTTRVASRTQKKCCVDSTTLQYAFEFLSHNSVHDRYSDLKFAELEELSLIGEFSFHRFIHMCKARHMNNLIRMAFMGDHLQLPSVEPGNVIHDLRRMPSLIACQTLEKNHRINSESLELAAAMNYILKDDFKGLSTMRYSTTGQFQVVKYDPDHTHKAIFDKYNDQDPSSFQFLSYLTEKSHSINAHYLINSGWLSREDLPILSEYKSQYRPILPFFFVGEKICPKDNVSINGGRYYFDHYQAFQVSRIVDIIKSNNTKREVGKTDDPYSIDFADNSRATNRYIELIDLLSGDEYSIEWSPSMIETFIPAYCATIHSFQGEQCAHGETFLENYNSNLILKVAVGRFQKSCTVHIKCRPGYNEWDELQIIMARKEPIRISSLGKG